MSLKQLPKHWGILLPIYLAIFVSFLYPVFNPDLFWHLAAARAAEKAGKLFLSQEIFSFTKPGIFWLNYEWLFEWIVWNLYKIGGFRLIVLFRASLLVSVAFVMDCYLARMAKNRQVSFWHFTFLRLANVIFTFIFISTRGTEQPELFSLLFLGIFFFLRDRLLGLGKTFLAGTLANPKHALPILGGFFALFALWANIHGGFVWGLTVLGLQFAARALEWANLKYKERFYKETPEANALSEIQRELTLFFLLGIVGFIATLVNPYGFRVYEVILKHLQDASLVAFMIDEWQPSQFYMKESWPYVALLVWLLVNLTFTHRKRGRLPIESILLLLAFGNFASSHIRNIALFGMICLPLLWEHVLSFELGSRMRRLNLAVVGVCFCVGLGFLGKVSFREARKVWSLRGLPREHLRREKYPYQAVRFMVANPEILKLPTMVEWGWAGYAIWELYEKGLKVFFDGRYLFHDVLHASMHAAEDPLEWEAFAKKHGIDCYLIKYPEEYRPVSTPIQRTSTRQPHYAWIQRSWHGVSILPEMWALVWWDNRSLLFVRRSKVSRDWLRKHEYASRLPFDPYWVEHQVKRKQIKLEILAAELERNRKEAGSHQRNQNLMRVLSVWQSDQKAQ